MQRGLGFSGFPRGGWERFGKAQNEAWGGVWAAHAFQEREGFWKGQTFKTNYEKLFLFFMVP